MHIITGKVRGYEEIWFFGDNFGFRSYLEHFNERDPANYDGYVKMQYSMKGFFTNKFTHHDQNAVSRLCNVIAKAIQDRTLLLKIMVIVPDDDLITYVNINNYGFTKAMTRIVDNIMKQHTKYVEIQKDFLPERSKRPLLPQIIWIQAPLHDNFHNNNDRTKFNKILAEVAQLHPNTSALALKKVWDPSDTRLYVAHSRFTSLGLTTYWAAIDKTIKFADTILLKKWLKQAENNYVRSRKNPSKNKYKWRRCKGNTTPSKPKGRKLPTPSKRRTVSDSESSAEDKHSGSDFSDSE